MEKEKKMRKKISMAVILVLIVSGMTFAGGGRDSSGDGQYRFIYGDTSPIGDLRDRANSLMVQRLRERSGGRIHVDYFPASQLGNDIDQIQSVIVGAQTLWGADLSWLANWVPDMNILGWGFTFRDTEHWINFLRSDLFRNMMSRFETEQNMKFLGVAPQGSRILSSKTPIRSLADLQNKKMRVPEIESYLRLWEALGTSPTPVAWAELYMALTQGLVDACEGPINSTYQSKIHEAAPYITLTNHVQVGFLILMNGGIWGSLPSDLQNVVQGSADDAIAYFIQEADKTIQEALDSMRAEGATLITLTNIAEWQEKIRDATAAMEARGLWSRGLFDEIQRIR